MNIELAYQCSGCGQDRGHKLGCPVEEEAMASYVAYIEHLGECGPGCCDR